jgi:hypothetical protein
MRYRSAGLAVMFVGDNTLTIQMPMLIDGKCIERGPKPTDRQLEAFDIGAWCSKAVTGEPKKPAVKKKGSGLTRTKTDKKATAKETTTDLTDCTDKPKAIDLAEQLRQALLARLAA